jgi:peptidoglycan L-alanyl-D-glutamate endopeptidase CwlK
MPEFSDKSLKRLSTVHPDLQTLFQTVIKHRDCTVTSGLRTQEEQAALYAKGRTEPGDIVTYMDGVNRRSRHQTGLAVDVCPYPEMWNTAALTEFGNFVKGVATMLKAYGAIDNDITWGGDWEWSDKPHWEI